MGRGIAVRYTRSGTHQPLAVMFEHALLRTARNGLLRHGEHHHHAIALLHGQSHAVTQTGTVFLIHHQFLNHHLYIMVAVTVQFHAGLYLTHLTVHTHVYISLAAYALKQLLVMALAVTYQRSQHVDSLSLIVRYDALHYLLLGELDHLLTGKIRERLTRTGKQKSQIIIDFGHGSNCRARIAVSGFLFN